jgi:hypothetical protein
MSLINCPECSNKISSEAPSCPKCGFVNGAKKKKKTGIFTKMFAFFLVVVFIGRIASLQDNDSYSKNTGRSTSSGTASNSSPVSNEKDSSERRPSWSTVSSKDEMTQKESHYATSPYVSSTKPMRFPYQDIDSWIGVGCNSDSHWVYFGFSKAPNLTNKETRDGYNDIGTQVKWDDTIEDVRLIQKWGARSLNFHEKDNILERLMKSRNVLLSLDWHGQNNVYFKYSLNGSSAAINEILSKCKIGK